MKLENGLKKVFHFIKKLEILPNVFEWDERKEGPKELYKKMGDAHILPYQTGNKWY